MFFKKLANGKYRYYEKYYDEREEKWKQASVTLTSKTRQAKGQARRLLDEKISKNLLYENIETVNKKKLQNLTIREVYDEYKIFRQIELKDSTYTTQIALLDKIFRNILDKKIDEVSANYFQSLLVKNDNSLSYKKLQKTLINMFFKYSIKLGYTNKNPIENVELPKKRITFDELNIKKANFFSKEEMKLFKSFFGNAPHEIRLNFLIEFMYLTGLRVGEALALKWDNIDIEKKRIEVKYTIDNHSVSLTECKLTSPKTINSFRVVTINKRCIEILLKMNELNKLKEARDGSFVFLSKTGNLINPNTLNIYLKNIGRKAKINNKEPEYFSSHMLRHSHISLLTELGIPIKSIMERVGHKDEKTTLQIYTHVTDKMKKDVVIKLDSFDF